MTDMNPPTTAAQTERDATKAALFLFMLRYNSSRMSQTELADWYEMKVMPEYSSALAQLRQAREALAQICAIGWEKKAREIERDLTATKQRLEEVEAFISAIAKQRSVSMGCMCGQCDQNIDRALALVINTALHPSADKAESNEGGNGA